MRINPKFNKQVKVSVTYCRRIIISSTIGLLKEIAEVGQTVHFDSTLIMFQRNGKSTETILANRIAFCCGHGDDDFYVVYTGDKGSSSSLSLSLDNLLLIYNEVRRLVREY